MFGVRRYGIGTGVFRRAGSLEGEQAGQTRKVRWAGGFALLCLSQPHRLHLCATTHAIHCHSPGQLGLSTGTMDWTGGTRRRFVGAKNNNTALQKQKAHFAKARAAIQHEPVPDRLHRSHPASRNTPRPAGMQHSRHGTSLRPDSSVRLSRSRASQTVAHNDDTRAHSSRGIHDASLLLLASSYLSLTEVLTWTDQHTIPTRRVTGMPGTVLSQRARGKETMKSSACSRDGANFLPAAIGLLWNLHDPYAWTFLQPWPTIGLAGERRSRKHPASTPNLHSNAC